MIFFEVCVSHNTNLSKSYNFLVGRFIRETIAEIDKCKDILFPIPEKKAS